MQFAFLLYHFYLQQTYDKAVRWQNFCNICLSDKSEDFFLGSIKLLLHKKTQIFESISPHVLHHIILFFLSPAPSPLQPSPSMPWRIQKPKKGV